VYDRKDYGAGYKPDQTKRLLWKALNRQIEVLETIRHWMEHAVDHVPIRWLENNGKVRDHADVWQDVTTTMRWMLNVDGIPQALGDAYSASPLQHPHELFDQSAIGRLHRAMDSRWNLLSSMSDGQIPKADQLEEGFQSLIVWMDDFAAKTFKPYGDAVTSFWDEYNEFIALDAVVYPLEAIGEIHAKDIIRTVRISPVDAKLGFSERDINAKLSGDSFAHFAGFFKRSWRSNDIMWGRLDGLCQLVQLLFSKERIKTIADTDYRRSAIRAAMGMDTNGSAPLRAELESVFPSAGHSSIQRIGTWLEGLFSNDAAKRDDAGSNFDEHLTLLISMAQLDIIKSDVPKVVKDAIVEQNTWNAFRIAKQADFKAAERIVARSRWAAAVGRKSSARDIAVELATVLGPNVQLVHEYYIRSKPASSQLPAEQKEIVRMAIEETIPVYDPGGGAFKAASSRVDPLVMTAAAEYYGAAGFKHLEEGPESPEPAYTKFGEFFRTSYRVGSETIIDHIPKIVLLELFCRALLVLKNCFLTSLDPASRGRVEGNVVFRWLFDIPPRILLAISIAIREDSSVKLALKSGFTALAMAAVTIGVVYWNPLIYNPTGGSPFTVKWFLFLFVLPFVALWWIWLARMHRILGWAMTALGALAAADSLNRVLRPDAAFVNDVLGFHVGGIALQFATNTTRATDLIDKLPNLPRALDLDNYLIIPFYLLAFSGFGFWILTRPLLKLRWLGAVVFGLSLAAGSADFIENQFIASLIGNVTDADVKDVLMAARVKWSVLSVMLLCVAICSGSMGMLAHKMKKHVPLVIGGLTMLSATAAGVAGLRGVYQLSPIIEWSLVGLLLSLVAMGLLVLTATGRRSA